MSGDRPFVKWRAGARGAARSSGTETAADLETEVDLLRQDLSEALARAKRLRHQIEAHVAEYNRALDHVRSLVADEAADQNGPPHLPAEDATPRKVSEGMRTIVVQVALSGRTREEMAQWLHEHLGIADGGAVVEAALNGD